MPRRKHAYLVLTMTLTAGLAGAAFTAEYSRAADSTRGPAEVTLAVVTVENVYVRSGAAESYYPFGRLGRGAVVEVIGEKFNWARVATRGPAFAAGTGSNAFFGHIVYPQGETGRFRVNADGRTGVTLGRMDVLAPNLNTDFNPNDSWKPLVRLETDTTVAILSTSTAANNVVHRIALPENAEGWISKAHLRPATAEEAAAWRRAAAGAKRVEAATPSQQRTEEPQPKGPQPAPNAKVTPAQAEQMQPPARELQAEPIETVVAAPPAQPVLAREEHRAPEVMPEKGVAASASEAKEPVVKELARVTMDDLEALLQKLRSAPAEIAEIGNLRQMYLEFATRNASDRAAARFASARAEQLEIWRTVRERQAELVRIRERAQLNAERADMALLSIYAHADYDTIGRLVASTIFDGQRLPRMLRLQEPGTNRTLAYIEPEGHGFDMIEMLGLWIGVVGEKSYDPALRLNIITPKRIDLLAPQQ